MTDLESPAADLPVALGPELTIAQAAQCRDTLLDALCTTGGALQLDLSGVSDIDSAGVQLLLAARRSMAGRGAALQLLNPSAEVRHALAVLGLDSALEATGAAR